MEGEKKLEETATYYFLELILEVAILAHENSFTLLPSLKQLGGLGLFFLLSVSAFLQEGGYVRGNEARRDALRVCISLSFYYGQILLQQSCSTIFFLFFLAMNGMCEWQ